MFSTLSPRQLRVLLNHAHNTAKRDREREEQEALENVKKGRRGREGVSDGGFSGKKGSKCGRQRVDWVPRIPAGLTRAPLLLLLLFFPPPTVNIMEDELQIELELKRSQKQLPPHLYLQYLNWPDPREVKKMSSLKSLPLNETI